MRSGREFLLTKETSSFLDDIYQGASLSHLKYFLKRNQRIVDEDQGKHLKLNFMNMISQKLLLQKLIQVKGMLQSQQLFIWLLGRRLIWVNEPEDDEVLFKERAKLMTLQASVILKVSNHNHFSPIEFANLIKEATLIRFSF